MNYYIQGNKDKAEEIKAAFEAKGYDISWPGGLAEPNVINIGVERNGAKYVVAETAEYIRDLIKTHPDYKELKLPVEPKFKVGDWVVRKDGEPFCGGNYAEQITLIEGDGYLKCIWFSSGTWLRENDIRLWSVADIKDGDVLVTTMIRSCPFIYRKTSYKNDLAYYYAGIDGNGDFSEGCLKRTLCHFGPTSDIAPATKEQRDLLFKKMKEAGYEWDAEKKELKKIKPHYDIKNFHVGMPVLVRNYNNNQWEFTFFGRYQKDKEYPFRCADGYTHIQCIPYEGNEALLGTTDMCDEQYINW